MDPVNYWPMAIEYSVWNATRAALQFWTADLEAHMLSSAIELVYNAFSIPLLHTCYASSLMRYYLVTLWPPWMIHLKVNSSLTMKAMTVVVKILTYPHHLEELPWLTTFPVLSMHPSTYIQSHHTALAPRNHIADSYTDAELSVLLMKMMTTPQWRRFHLQTVHCQCSTTQLPSRNCLPSAPSTCMLL